MTDTKSPDRVLLESMQARLHEKIPPDVYCRALKKRLKKHIGVYRPIVKPVLCKVCNKAIKQKGKGAPKRICGKRCKKKRQLMYKNSPGYKKWRKEYDASPEQRARRQKYNEEVYLPRQERVDDETS